MGVVDWKDADKVGKVISEEIPAKVAADPAYQNAMRKKPRPLAACSKKNTDVAKGFCPPWRKWPRAPRVR